jgi:hypothetical protein
MAAPHRRCGLGMPREASTHGRVSHTKLYDPINAGRIDERDSRTFIDRDSIDCHVRRRAHVRQKNRASENRDPVFSALR